MKQQKGRVKGIILASTIAIVACNRESFFTDNVPITGLLEGKPVRFEIPSKDTGKVAQEMLVLKQISADGDTVLRMASPQYAKVFQNDPTITSIKTMIGIQKILKK